MNQVRVRFAPSPTGFLHVGGARTALFNWLFARHAKGKFFLRIEDTDLSRSTDEAIEAIFDGMRWLGLDWDLWEGSEANPVRQTARFDVYREKVETLLEQEKAYRCYCSPEELVTRRKEALKARQVPRYDGRCRQLTAPVPGRPAAIRFKASSVGEIVVDDMVKGKVVFDSRTVDDLIIMRSDGSPTYNFCVVVDDVDMQISHVIRGDDHLNNTPKQIQLYKALGYAQPRFGHLSMILGSDKSRLSKRYGATSVQQYREEGYLPEAMVNYLVRLGWSHKDQELFTLPEMIEKFSMERVGSSAAIFNQDKLLWINANYIKTGDLERIAQLLHPHLQGLGIDPGQLDPDHLLRVVNALRERSRTLKEMAESAFYFFSDKISFDDKAQKFLTVENLLILKTVREKLEKIPFEHDPLREVFKSISASMDKKLAKVAQPVRAAVTGKTVSPGIFDVLEVLGKEKALERLDFQIESLSQTEKGSMP
ncbi:MAG: glutamate--tRNA ligase [Nitrospira sp.]|nr:glutamate--tRNA ligase [Candidatus Manganitrophaceae bacterium]HIL35619.1 glutamate--tRNA ligase [Candidatus Manganitrophaceae bacterium]